MISPFNVGLPALEPAVDEGVEDDDDAEGEEEVEGGRDERVPHPVRLRVHRRRGVAVLPGQGLKYREWSKGITIQA